MLNIADSFHQPPPMMMKNQSPLAGAMEDIDMEKEFVPRIDDSVLVVGGGGGGNSVSMIIDGSFHQPPPMMMKNQSPLAGALEDIVMEKDIDMEKEFVASVLVGGNNNSNISSSNSQNSVVDKSAAATSDDDDDDDDDTLTTEGCISYKFSISYCERERVRARERAERKERLPAYYAELNERYARARDSNLLVDRDWMTEFLGDLARKGQEAVEQRWKDKDYY